MSEHSHDEVEIASPDEQRAAIDAAMIERLGDNWRKEWIIVHDANELVRVNQGDINLDFQADLLAHVDIIERPANPVQLSGRLVAFMILGIFMFVAFAIASIAGVFGG
ncbi:MAG: hypothetical protein WBC91_19560 [Phototrophicaceae bacterium]